MLVRTLARIRDDPYDRLRSAPLENRPRDRLAELRLLRSATGHLGSSLAWEA